MLPSCRGVATSQALPGTRTLMIMPFENLSKTAGLDWIGESFPEALAQRMTSPQVYVIARDDRNYAFDHAGIPLTCAPVAGHDLFRCRANGRRLRSSGQL